MPYIILRNSIFLGVIFLLLSACGGGGNQPPIANAGPDQTLGNQTGDVIILDGSASSDADGQVLSYQWKLQIVPSGSNATITDATSANASFTADMPGQYTVRLVVNDGQEDSQPDEMVVMVEPPAPTVTITSPNTSLSISDTSTVTIQGTVDDPLAEITVNGSATPNNSGNYTAKVKLPKFFNTVTVIATNNAGKGSAEVLIYSRNGPDLTLKITTPREGFTSDAVLKVNVLPGSDPVKRPPDSEISIPGGLTAIPTRVSGTFTTTNGLPAPTVTVNGQPAALSMISKEPILQSFCNKFPVVRLCKADRYNFAYTVFLPVGDASIVVVVVDNKNNRITDSVNGVADYCLNESVDWAWDPASDQLNGTGLAVRGDASHANNYQSNRCHQVDGCSNYVSWNGEIITGADTNSPRNVPLSIFPIYWGLSEVHFGSGYAPVSDSRNDFFAHGKQPKDKYGCNFHDVCYQTCVQGTEEEKEAARVACNDQQLDRHKDACRSAFPEPCPYKITGPLGNTIPDPIKCPLYFGQKINCFTKAYIYRGGLYTKGAKKAFTDDQHMYCAN